MPADAQSSPQLTTAFLAKLGAEAEARGVSRATFERATAGLATDPEIIALANTQPEHVRPVGQYVDQLVSEERIADGRARLAELSGLLDRIEVAFGVERHILVAIWGIESGYGAAQGVRDVIRSLATLAAADRRRPAFWRSELLAALAILERSGPAGDRMSGSWAGAMGHTQFMPSTHLAHAVDFDGDGRIDLWGSAADALASTANYLKASGWRTGVPWGFEVTLPGGFAYGLAAPGRGRSAAGWRALGVGRPDDRPWPGTEADLELLLPAGWRGPAFLVSGNFAALLRYNPASAYALAVGHLADRLGGGPPIAGRWPDEERALAAEEREELQRRLVARGLDTGGVDGILGIQSRAAIRAYQRGAGLPEDGHPSEGLLLLLRREDGG